MHRRFSLGPQPILPGVRPACVAVGLALRLFSATPALAQTSAEAELAAPATEFEAQPRVPWSPALDTQLSFGIAVEGGAGITVFAGAAGTEAHGVVEGLLRARWRYFQLGALIEQSDHTEREWRTLGGFAGAFLPYRNWVDLELSAGLGTRRFHSTDPRYGPEGYEVSSVTLLLRAGVSDRSTEKLFGVRLGAHLAIASDFTSKDVSWRYNLGSEALPRYVTGSTPVGGHSFALVVGGGFELAPARTRLRASP